MKVATEEHGGTLSEYNSFNIVFYFSEIEYKSNFTTGAFQVIDSLSHVYWRQTFFGLYFENNLIEDHKISIKLMRENDILILNFVLLFSFILDISQIKLVFKSIFIHNFKKAAPKLFMNFYSCLN